MAYTRSHATTLQVSFELLDRTIAVVLPSLAERQRWESVLEYAIKHGSLPLPKAQPEARAQVRCTAITGSHGAAEQAGASARTHARTALPRVAVVAADAQLTVAARAVAQSWHGTLQRLQWPIPRVQYQWQHLIRCACCWAIAATSSRRGIALCKVVLWI